MPDFFLLLGVVLAGCSASHHPAHAPAAAAGDAGASLDVAPAPPGIRPPCAPGLVRERDHCVGWSGAGDERIWCGPTAHAARVDAMLLPDGRAVVQGDCTVGDSGFEQRILEYNPRTNRFTEIAALPPGGVRTPDGLGVVIHAVDVGERTTALLDDGSVLIVGGSLYAHPEPPHLYEPATGRLLGTAQQYGWYDRGAAVRLLDGRILVVGYGTEIYTRVP